MARRYSRKIQEERISAKQLGIDHGIQAAEAAIESCREGEISCDRDTLQTEAFEAEENARQYSPFEFHANEFNSSEDPDAVWEAYDEGVYSGIKHALRKGGFRGFSWGTKRRKRR